MAVLSKTWTTSADFDTGVYSNCNSSLVPDEIQKDDDGGATNGGVWTGTYDPGSGKHPLWEIATIHFVTVGTSFLVIRYRATNDPDSTGDPWLGPEQSPASSPWSVSLLPAARKRYLQLQMYVFPNPSATVANARLLDVSVSGQSTTPAISPGLPIPLEPVPQAGAFQASCDQPMAHASDAALAGAYAACSTE